VETKQVSSATEMKARTLTPGFKASLGHRATHVPDGKDSMRRTITYFEGVRLRVKDTYKKYEMQSPSGNGTRSARLRTFLHPV